MADGNLVSTNTVIPGATLTLLNQPFEMILNADQTRSSDSDVRHWYGIGVSSNHLELSVMRKSSTSPSNGETLNNPSPSKGEEVRREKTRRYPVVREFPEGAAIAKIARK
ncbi:hypothetical protein Tco_0442779 [Tanacetum coccineum]